MAPEDHERPIGFWLKQVDRLIDAGFEAELGTAGVTRRQWQLLNLLVRGPSTAQQLAQELAPFLERTDDLATELAGLQARGWVAVDGGAIVGGALVGGAIVGLTAEGEAGLDQLSQRVVELRERSMAGVSPADYLTTTAVLQRIAANLSATTSP